MQRLTIRVFHFAITQHISNVPTLANVVVALWLVVVAWMDYRDKVAHDWLHCWGVCAMLISGLGQLIWHFCLVMRFS